MRLITLKGNNIWYGVIILILSLYAFATIFPFYNVIVTSFTSEFNYYKNPLMLIPKDFNIDSYVYVLSNSKILTAFLNSVLICVSSTVLSLFLTITCAYVLTKKDLIGINLLFIFIIITMFFSGGLVPFYLLVKNLGLIDHMLVYILPSAINTFYMIIMLNSFRQIPDSLLDSAKIDGANDIRILFQIIVPLSMPVIMCITLFVIVDKWNDWMSAMLFIKDSSKFNLMYVLRTIVVDVTSPLNDVAASELRKIKTVFPAGIQRASIIITILPIMLIYPYIQKYFVKGIMIGSVKG